VRDVGVFFDRTELVSIIDDFPPPAALWTAKAPSTKLAHRYASPRKYARVSCRMELRGGRDVGR
jgi:hypothetical protein